MALVQVATAIIEYIRCFLNTNLNQSCVMAFQIRENGLTIKHQPNSIRFTIHLLEFSITILVFMIVLIAISSLCLVLTKESEFKNSSIISL